jgi:hypothetical protein
MLINNKPHETPVRAFLTRLVNDPDNHAKFLNMLSMLEHMGSRKIMVSQMKYPERMSQDTLQHLAEEARHAYFFKRHAERIAKKELVGWVDENTMCRIPALMYFGRMDAGILKYLKLSSPRPALAGLNGGDPEKTAANAADTMDPVCANALRACQRDDEHNCYGWVSLIIELRACWLYKIYNEVVDAQKVHLPLAGLLAEEDQHLAEMFGMCGENHEQLADLSRYETQLFEKLWTALEEAYPVPADNRKAA